MDRIGAAKRDDDALRPRRRCPWRRRRQYRLRLHQARSNDPDARTGAHLYSTKVAPEVVDLDKVAAHVAVSSVFREHPEEFRVGAYTVRRQERNGRDSGGMRLSTGTVQILSTATGQSRSIQWASLHRGGLDVTAGTRSGGNLRSIDQRRTTVIEAFDKGEMEALIRLLERDWGSGLHHFSDMFRDGRREALDRLLFAGRLELESLQTAAQNMRARGVSLDMLPLRRALEQRLEQVMSDLSSTPFDLSLLNRITRLVKLGQDLGLEPDLWKSQAAYIEMARTWSVRPKPGGPGEANRAADEWREGLSALGRALHVRYP